MSVTAKVILATKGDSSDGQVVLTFVADYADDRNKEWSKYTPALDLHMTVVDQVADEFTRGQRFTLSFDPED